MGKNEDQDGPCRNLVKTHRPVDPAPVGDPFKAARQHKLHQCHRVADHHEARAASKGRDVEIKKPSAASSLSSPGILSVPAEASFSG